MNYVSHLAYRCVERGSPLLKATFKASMIINRLHNPLLTSDFALIHVLMLLSMDCDIYTLLIHHSDSHLFYCIQLAEFICDEIGIVHNKIS